jgi:hypothetical protein
MTLLTNIFTYWKFDEGTGNGATDYVGNQDGMLHNENIWSNPARKLGPYGLDFSLGTSDIGVQVGIQGLPWNFLHNGTTDWSFGCWIYRQSTALAGMLFCDTPGADARGLQISVNNRSISVTIGKSGAGYPIIGSTFSDVLANAAGWNFIVVTMSIAEGVNQCKLYVNGACVGEATRSTSFESGDNVGYPLLGQYGIGDDSNKFNSYFDEAFSYKRVLSAGEVKALYNNGTGAQYPFDGIIVYDMASNSLTLQGAGC